MKKPNDKKAGFTLVELLIVIIILGVLAALISGNFFTSLKKGRDARRKADLEQIQKALELYYEDNRAYPSTLPASGGQLTGSGGKVYMQQIPSDPIAGVNYMYCTNTAMDQYQLYSHLENLNDPKLIATINPLTSCNVANCGATSACRYGIGSSDVTP